MFSKISVSLLLVTSLLALISLPGCKDDNNVQTDDVSIYQPQFEGTKALLSLDSLVVNYSRGGMHPKAALQRALSDLKGSPQVKHVAGYDSSCLFLRLNSGIGKVYNVRKTDKATTLLQVSSVFDLSVYAALKWDYSKLFVKMH